MKLTFKNIAPYLSTGQNNVSRWLSYLGLGIGVLLLLSSIQMYININDLLKTRSPKKNGFDYIPITKIISNENMAGSHAFTLEEIGELRQQSFIEDLAPFQSNRFVIKADGGATLPFSSDIFFEAIDERFLDTLPPGFSWKEGQTTIPVIISSDYLELYNSVFAPSRNLPQFSESSISLLRVSIECYGFGETRSYRGNIMALSDRINTVIVPTSFLNWANQHFAGVNICDPNKLMLKTKDANNPQLLNFLQQKNYHVNRDKTKFGRIKQVLQAIVSGLAVFGILVILLAMVLFSFYLELMIARSKENLQLLLMLGYSPKWLSKTVAKKWLPVYILVILGALGITAIMHWAFQHYVMHDREELSPLINWMVLIVAMGLLSLCIFVNFRLVRKLLFKL